MRTLTRAAEPRTRCLRDSPGRASTGGCTTDPTVNRPTIRRPTRPCTNQTAEGKNNSTINRPHASRPTPHQRGMKGSKRRSATPWCATPADDHIHGHNRTAQLYHCTTDQPKPTNNFKPTGPRGARKVDRVGTGEHASRHASPVARASSSCLNTTENRPRWGCLLNKASGPASAPSSPESRG